MVTKKHKCNGKVVVVEFTSKEESLQQGKCEFKITLDSIAAEGVECPLCQIDLYYEFRVDSIAEVVAEANDIAGHTVTPAPFDPRTRFAY
jgi:hypothetical protein